MAIKLIKDRIKDFFDREIIQEALLAYKWRFPDKVDVTISRSSDGGYVVEIKNLPGCLTQAEDGRKIFEMVNDAIYTYLKIPQKYYPFMPVFFPSEEVREQFKIEIPAKYLSKDLVLQRT